MRILQLTTHMNIGGIAVYTANLSRALKERGHVVFAASSGGSSENRLAECGIQHFRVDLKTKSELSPKVIKSLGPLMAVIRAEKIELVHAHTRVAAVSAALASFVTGVPYVTTCHGFFKRRIGRMLFGCWGRKVVAISEAVKRHLAADFGVPESKIALIYTGVDTAKFSKDLSDEEKAKARCRFGLGDSAVVGTIGRFSPVKGQRTLLRAAKIVLQDFPGAKILLIGGGPDEFALKELASRMGIEKNVVFAASADDTREPLSAMDVFVLPSVKEGLGLALIEAMAYGRPCIASRTGGVEDIIEDGMDGILFTPEDAAGLAAAVKKMLSDKTARESAAKNGREKALRDFTLDKMAAQMEALYKEAMIYAGR